MDSQDWCAWCFNSLAGLISLYTCLTCTSYEVFPSFFEYLYLKRDALSERGPMIHWTCTEKADYWFETLRCNIKDVRAGSFMFS